LPLQLPVFLSLFAAAAESRDKKFETRLDDDQKLALQLQIRSRYTENNRVWSRNKFKLNNLQGQRNKGLNQNE